MERWTLCFALLFLTAALLATPDADIVETRVADGFDEPVGKPDGEGYYTSRGFHRYHPGEDWNGSKGGNSDLGAPVYAIGHGYVTFARNAKMGWGNVVLLRHVYLEGGQERVIDSMYAHLDSILVREGQQVTRGQQVGTIGTNCGMYVAHLHFEIRKNLGIGINRSAFSCDLKNYFQPGEFIAAHRKIEGGGGIAKIQANTYSTGKVVSAPTDESALRRKSPEKFLPFRPPAEKKNPFRVNRFEDL